MRNFTPLSTEAQVIKLRVRAGEWEFEANGEVQKVIQQFDKFLDLINRGVGTIAEKASIQENLRKDRVLPSSISQKTPLPLFERIFETAPHSSILISRTPPSGKEAEANLALLLLLGYLELRGVSEVTVLALKQAIKHSMHPVLRLDRVLGGYIKDRFVIKIGRGKGGRYRLTPLGIKKATTIAEELTSEWKHA